MGFGDWLEETGNMLYEKASNMSLKDGLNTASCFAGLIPIPLAADAAEVLLSAGATVAGICADPDNWKKELAEGVGNIAVAAVPIPGLSAAKRTGVALKDAVKAEGLLKGAATYSKAAMHDKSFKTSIMDEVVEGVVYEHGQKYVEIGVENGAYKLEPVFSSNDKTLPQLDILTKVKAGCIQAGIVQVGPDGKMIESEENYQTVYKEYQKAKTVLHNNGIEVQMSPSHKVKEVLPMFYDTEHKVKQSNEETASVEMKPTDLPANKQENKQENKENSSNKQEIYIR